MDLTETPFQRAHHLEGERRAAARASVDRQLRQETLTTLWQDLPAPELLADLALLLARLQAAITDTAAPPSDPART